MNVSHVSVPGGSTFPQRGVGGPTETPGMLAGQAADRVKTDLKKLALRIPGLRDIASIRIAPAVRLGTFRMGKENFYALD